VFYIISVLILIFQAHTAAVEAEWTVGRMWQYMQDIAERHRHDLTSEMLLGGIISEEHA